MILVQKPPKYIGVDPVSRLWGNMQLSVANCWSLHSGTERKGGCCMTIDRKSGTELILTAAALTLMKWMKRMDDYLTLTHIMQVALGSNKTPTPAEIDCHKSSVLSIERLVHTFSCCNPVILDSHARSDSMSYINLLISFTQVIKVNLFAAANIFSSWLSHPEIINYNVI